MRIVSIVFVLVVFAVGSMCHAQTRQTKSNSRPVAAQIEFNAMPLVDVIDYLRDTTNLNIYVNWPALEMAGVSMDAPITLKGRNLSAAKVLSMALAQAGQGRLSWFAADGVVQVTTQELADRNLVTRVYDVKDLLVEVPDFEAPAFNDNGVTRAGGNGGSGMFSGSGTSTESRTREERGEDLVELVITLIRPDVWQQNGGPARIQYFAGYLVVTAPLSVHARL
jgi:hypothetical protein